jgi:acyl-CoA synthetase (AMP-forming)/AMP-acid ligase II
MSDGNTLNEVLHELDAAKRFPQLIRGAAAAYGDDLAITLKGDTIPDDALSFRELDLKSAELAKGLLARGAGKGSRIGFIYGNSPSFALMLAAITRMGGIAVPISTLLKSNELTRVLRQSDITGLIVQRKLLGNDYVARLCDALPELNESGPELRIPKTPYLRWIVSTGEALPRSVHGMDFLIDAAKSVSDAFLQEVESEIHPTDQALEIYTSGSMALPKGVKHTHGGIISRSHFLKNMVGTKRGAKVAAGLPMFWVGGLMMYLVPNWEIGATTTCTEGTSTSSRFAMGTVMAAEDLAMMQQMNTIWGLGMTETLGPYSWGDYLRDPRYPLCAPMSHIAPNYEVRVADADGNPVGPGERGEIQVRGYALTPGLHKLERADYFTPDGYYHTGDMAIVEDGTIFFVGRDGDMIKSANSNVSPAEVEMELQALPSVHSAYVVGIPDKERGQLVVAALVAREGAEINVEEIQTTLRQKLSSFKVPRAYVPMAREEIPMLPSNKVSRRILEKILAEKLGR